MKLSEYMMNKYKNKLTKLVKRGEVYEKSDDHRKAAVEKASEQYMFWSKLFNQ